jgi:putative membrane protein
MMEALHLKYLVAALTYSFVGIAFLVIAFWIIEKITPENLWKEILDKQNMALAILAASFVIGISIIIASAIHG